MRTAEIQQMREVEKPRLVAEHAELLKELMIATENNDPEVVVIGVAMGQIEDRLLEINRLSSAP